MSNYPVTLSCNGCKQRFRLTRMEPSVIISAAEYCPMCGHHSVGVVQSSEQDFWEVMATSYGMQIKLLKLLYMTWTEEPSHYHRFGDYIESVIREAD